MNRLPSALLDDIIEHQGETSSGQVSAYAIWQLALDLKEARAKVSALEQAKEDRRHEAMERSERD